MFNLKYKIMEFIELLLFFLKAWSIVWSFIYIMIGFTLLFQKNDRRVFRFNLRTCFEICLYATSLYVWYL